MEPVINAALKDINEYAMGVDQRTRTWFEKHLEKAMNHIRHTHQPLSVEEIIVKNVSEQGEGFVGEILRRVDKQMYYPHTNNPYIQRLAGFLDQREKNELVALFAVFNMFGDRSLLIISLILNSGFGINFGSSAFLKLSAHYNHLVGRLRLPETIIVKGYEEDAFSVIDGQLILNEEYHDDLEGQLREQLVHLVDKVNRNHPDDLETLATLFNECLRASNFRDLYYGITKLSRFATLRDIVILSKSYTHHDPRYINLIEYLFLTEVTKIIY